MILYAGAYNLVSVFLNRSIIRTRPFIWYFFTFMFVSGKEKEKRCSYLSPKAASIAHLIHSKFHKQFLLRTDKSFDIQTAHNDLPLRPMRTGSQLLRPVY